MTSLNTLKSKALEDIKNYYTKLNYEAAKTYNGCISRSSPSNKARQIFVQENSKPVIHSCIYYCCNSGRFLLRRPVRCRPDAARQFTYRQSHNSSWRPFKTTILSGGSHSGSNPSARWRCDHKHRNCITICRPVALGQSAGRQIRASIGGAAVVGSPTKAAAALGRLL